MRIANSNLRGNNLQATPRKLMRLLGIAVAAGGIAVSWPAPADASFKIPTTKVQELAQKIKKNAELVAHAAENTRLWKDLFSKKAATMTAKIAAQNNATANKIARINLERLKIHNMDVSGAYLPIQKPCPSIDKSISMGGSVCGAVNFLRSQEKSYAQDSAQGVTTLEPGVAKGSMNDQFPAPIPINPSNQTINTPGSAIAPSYSLMAQNSAAAKTGDAIVKTAQSEIDAAGRNAAQSVTASGTAGTSSGSSGAPSGAAAKAASGASTSDSGPLILNPNLIIGNQAKFLSYTPQEQKIATQMAALLAPTKTLYGSLSGTAAGAGANVLEDAGSTIAESIARTTFMSLISQRVPPSGGQSQYLLLWKMADAAFGVGQPSQKGRVSLLRYIQDGSLSNPAQVMRKDALLKAEQTYMVVQKYATSLRREEVLATRLVDEIRGR